MSLVWWLGIKSVLLVVCKLLRALVGGVRFEAMHFHEELPASC